MNIEEEILKLYALSKTQEQQILDLIANTKQQIDQLNENFSLLREKTEMSDSIVIQQLAPQVQILREEVLSLKKRFPDN